MFLKSKSGKNFIFLSLFFPFKEKVKGRLGRTSERNREKMRNRNYRREKER